MSQQIALLAIQIGLIIVLARLFGMLATKCRIPSVMGELLAGILIGPYALGSVPLPLHGMEHGLFPLSTAVIGIPVDTTLYSIATLGSIVLLFISGLETDVRTFFKYSVVGTVVGIGGIVFSFACGAAVGLLVYGWELMDPRCLFLGILCTATSVGISARILSEHRCMDSPEGVTIMAAAVIDDVLGIVCLAIVIGIANVELNGGAMAWGNILGITIRSFGIWLGVTAVGLVCARRLASFLKIFKSSKLFAIQAFGLALILAGLFEQAGLAMIIGAFVMGLSLSKTDVAFRIRASLTPVYNFLVPLFFVVMGMLVDVRVLANPHVLIIGVIFSLMAILGKILGCSLPAFCMNFNGIGALRVGIGMIPRCEVVLIIAGIAATTMMKNPELKAQEKLAKTGETHLVSADAATVRDGHNAQLVPDRVPIFDSSLFGIAIIMPLITALLAPPLLSAVLSVKRKGVRREVPDDNTTVTSFTFHTEALANFALNEIIEMLHHDGFSTSAIGKDIRVIQFRRDKTSFSLEIEGTTFNFASQPDDVALINTTVYESLVELHKNLSELRQLARPDTLKSQIYGAPATHAATPTPPTRHAAASFTSLDKVITPENIIVNMTATTKNDAFRELLGLINLHTPLADPDKCYQDLLDRESIITTYQDGGIAMPHTRTNGTSVFTTAIGISAEGFEYDPGEDHKTHIVILSLCPNDEPGPYLQFISQVAQILSNEAKRKAVLSARTPAAAAKAFTG